MCNVAVTHTLRVDWSKRREIRSDHSSFLGHTHGVFPPDLNSHLDRGEIIKKCFSLLLFFVLFLYEVNISGVRGTFCTHEL